MADEFVENDDYESILRTERKIAADPQGPTPNEVAHGLGLDHPALTGGDVDGSVDPAAQIAPVKPTKAD